MRPFRDVKGDPVTWDEAWLMLNDHQRRGRDAGLFRTADGAFVVRAGTRKPEPGEALCAYATPSRRAFDTQGVEMRPWRERFAEAKRNGLWRRKPG